MKKELGKGSARVEAHCTIRLVFAFGSCNFRFVFRCFLRLVIPETGRRVRFRSVELRYLRFFARCLYPLVLMKGEQAVRRRGEDRYQSLLKL